MRSDPPAVVHATQYGVRCTIVPNVKGPIMPPQEGTRSRDPRGGSGRVTVHHDDREHIEAGPSPTGSEHQRSSECEVN